MNWNPESLTQEKLHEYRRAAEAAWGEDTRHESYAAHPQPSAGQCYVTSRWLTTKLGGHVGSKDGHYFWVSPDKTHVVDLTGDQFAYKPADMRFNGVQLDEEDEPWEHDSEKGTHRPGPVMFKRADHPLYKGFRTKNFATETPRVKVFVERANAALEGRLSKKADFGGDAYPGQEPQVVERMEHDKPGDNGPQRYKWIYGNGRLELSPFDDYDTLGQLAGLTGSDDSRPVALGELTVSGGRAEWRGSGNLGLSGLTHVLQAHTREAGWGWGGLTSLEGDQKLAHSMYLYWNDETGHLLMSPTPTIFPDMPGRYSRIDIVGKTARVDEEFYKYAAEGLDEWAEDHHYALNTGIKTVEDIDGYNTYGPRPDYAQGPTDLSSPTGTLKCPECGQVFPSFGQYILHRKEEEPAGDELDEQDGHFPEMDMDKVLPPHFVDRQPFVFPLAHTASLLDAHDEKLWHFSSAASITYGAFLDGEQVGNATVTTNGEILDMTLARNYETVFDSLIRCAASRTDKLTYSGEDAVTKVRLKMRGFVEAADGPYLFVAKGKEPTDLLPDKVPFIFDIEQDQIVVGQPGASHNTIMGKFTPGGIVQGFYEPGGTVTITTQTDYPWTVRHLVDLWYWSHPHMRVTDVQYEDPMGVKQKLASEWFKDPERAEWQHGLCDAYALALLSDHPHLRLGGAGNEFGPAHWFAHDDEYAYDSIGRHPLPYHGIDNQLPECSLDQDIEDWGLPENGSLEDIERAKRLARMHHPWLYGQRVTKTASNIGQYVKQLAATDPAVWGAYKALDAAGGEVFVVGGAVRDPLMGIEPNDIDLMVRGLPSDQVNHILKQLPGKVDLTGKAFGVYRYNHKGHEVEIALPRTEKSTGDRRVDFDVNVDHTLPVEDDLLRRDFTVNSMAVSLRDGRLVDPFGGAEDIEQKRLRTTHPDSFKEDPTRTLRALVMNARYGLQPDERTRAELEQHSHRIHDESWMNMQSIMDKLLKSKNPAGAFRLAQETGVLKHILPEVSSAWDFDQKNPHHNYPLGTHLMHVLEGVQEQSDDPDLRMAALLHDIGKPSSAWYACKDCDAWSDGQHHGHDNCRACGSPNLHGHYYQTGKTRAGDFLGDDGKIHNFGQDHDTVGSAMAERRLTHMNWPVARRKRVTELIRHHMFSAFSSGKGARKFLNRVGDHADSLLLLRHADQYGKGTDEYQDTKTPVDTMRQHVETARSTNAPTDVSGLAINGKDILALGIKPGPQVGQILNTLVQQVIENPELNNRDTLLGVAQQWFTSSPS